MSARVPRIERFDRNAPSTGAAYVSRTCNCGEPTEWIGVVIVASRTVQIELCWNCVFDFSEMEDCEITE